MIKPLGSRWLTAAGDVDAWGAALAALDDGGVDDAGAVARRTWEERYSPAVALGALEAAYRF
jgi:hypothetical protein